MTTTAIVPAGVKTPAAILESRRGQFLAALPTDVSKERFFALAVAVAKDPKLQGCTPLSVLDSIYRAAKFGFELDPLTGECYIIPRKVQGTLTACFQPGYRGLMKLARKSRTVADIHAEVVYEGEPYRVYLGTKRVIEHEPYYSVGVEPGKIVAAYVTWRDMQSGEMNFHTISRKRIDRARSMNPNSGPWKNDEAAMVRKTAIIDAAKIWQLSPEMAEAIAVDTRTEIGEPVPPVLPSSIVAERTDAKSELDDFEQTQETPASPAFAPGEFPADTSGSAEEAMNAELAGGMHANGKL